MFQKAVRRGILYDPACDGQGGGPAGFLLFVFETNYQGGCAG